jgi:hypothetical protein
MLRTGGSDAPAAESVAPVVLCVDDEPNILSSLRRQLRSLVRAVAAAAID